MSDKHPFLSRLKLDSNYDHDPHRWFRDKVTRKQGNNVFVKVLRGILGVAAEVAERKVRPLMTCSGIQRSTRASRRQVHDVMNELVQHRFLFRHNSGPRGQHVYLFLGADIAYLRDHDDTNAVLFSLDNRAVIEEVLGRGDNGRDRRNLTLPRTVKTAEQTEVEQDGEDISRRHGVKAGELHFANNEVDPGGAGTTSTSIDDEREDGDKQQQEADAEVVT